MGKFDKKEKCEYCEEKMTAVYRNKRFCSPKCRVYFNRENGKLKKQNKNQVVASVVREGKEMTKVELLRLMKNNNQF